METVRAVKDPEDDPKTGKPRPKSGVSFPYFDLDQSIAVASTIHEKAGGSCDLPQLAALLDYSGIRNGSFRMRVSAAKMFGLIEDADEQRLRVSHRGRAIVAPISDSIAERSKVEAFLDVELFKKVYDEFHGTTLPETAGLRNLLLTEHEVVPDRIKPTIRIMLDSAEQAGFFKATGNRSRMIVPISNASSTQATPPPPPDPVTKADPPVVHHGGGGGGGNGGGTGGGTIDPAILGLLQRLPPGGTPMSAKRRKALVDAFTATVDFIYPESDDRE